MARAIQRFDHHSAPVATVGMTLWLTAGIFTSSCGMFHKKPRAFSPPPVAAKVLVPTAPPELSPPPEVLAEVSPLDESLLPEATPQLSPPPPVRATRSPTPAKPVIAAQTPVEVPAAVVDPPPVPQLGQIYTPAQIRENTQTLENYLARVKRAVSVFANKNLNREDHATAESVKNFLMQAEQAKDKDLASAVALARRADTLANDLLGRLP